MIVRAAIPVDVDGINAFALGSEASSFYHNYHWGSVIEKTFGHPYHCLVCEGNDGRIRGLLPLVHMNSLLFGNMLVSMPFLNYGGVCAETEPAVHALVDEAIRLARELRVGHIEFRQVLPLGDAFQAKTHKVSMRLRLPAGSDGLWNSFPSKLRSQVKRSQKEAMTVRIGRADELDNFYRVFSICMRNLGTPVYPKAFFRNILDRFPDNAWICTVSLGSVPVASGFLLGYRSRMEIPWAAADRRYNRLSPNMLLYWNCLKFACEKGYAEFDFGRSTIDEGTYKFKEQWGATPTQLHWQYWLPDGGKLPELSPRNSKYELAIALWKKIPLPITKFLGPHIVKNIP